MSKLYITCLRILSCMRTNLLAPLLMVAAVASPALRAADPGCEVARLVSTGGPAPQQAHTLAIRWTGYSNFELAYGDQDADESRRHGGSGLHSQGFIRVRRNR